MRLLRHLFTALWLTACGVFASAAQAAGVNGLWSTQNGDYALFLQDATSGATFALQVPGSLDALRVWMGSGSASSLSLQGLVQPNDALIANVAGSSMSGTMTIGGVQQPFNAALALAWVGTEYAGIWQKVSPANAYFVFCVLETGNGRIGLQIDVTLNADKTTTYDIFTGALVNTQFTGLSVTGSGLTSRLNFGTGTLTGSSTTIAKPPQVTTFSATQVVKIAP
ncbi:hypothetical protein HLB44_33715 [Aquincola sp. S2]|uniref:Uncharacterized protein n=1 Tax=Pseudaquabacterium terrae TaxID=2732868 RepID=A0ABX2ET83_9BURK|nr:hypothetical protein [Aquabacterium terrae]NRF71955.1 hypothetical protein [Aquabacterium terrae]